MLEKFFQRTNIRVDDSFNMMVKPFWFLDSFSVCVCTYTFSYVRTDWPYIDHIELFERGAWNPSEGVFRYK